MTIEQYIRKLLNNNYNSFNIVSGLEKGREPPSENPKRTRILMYWQGGLPGLKLWLNFTSCCICGFSNPYFTFIAGFASTYMCRLNDIYVDCAMLRGGSIYKFSFHNVI